MTKCLACGTELNAEILGLFHPSCRRDGPSRPEDDEALRQRVLAIVHDAERNDPRSLQIQLGPSDLGSPCDRQIGYKLAGFPEINFRSDPWPAIVGKSIHVWMEGAINRYDAPAFDWQAEREIRIDDTVVGHTDVWAPPDVIDWKSASAERLKKFRKDGVPEQYQVQGQLYGFGHARMGRPVRDIVLVFLPRDGRVKDMLIYREPYDELIAKAALERMYQIAYQLIALDIENHPERWAEVPARPSRANCWYCPFFQERDAERTADQTGCPGYSETAETRLKKAQEGFWKK